MHIKPSLSIVWHKAGLFSLGMAVVGIIAVVWVLAATPIAFEAESGTVSGSASKASVTGASGGMAVRFGQSTPTPAPSVYFGTNGAITNPSSSGLGYYVHCSTGSDTNAGTSAGAAWKTLAKITNATFKPGDNIYLAAGCTFAGTLRLDENGTSAARISLGSYGSGAVPVIDANGLGTYANAIQINGAYNTVQNLKIIDAGNAAVAVNAASALVQNIEVTASGEAVEVSQSGNNAVLTHIDAHDLRLVVNTQGGDDDYGATGFAVGGTGVELSWSKCTNCVGPSFDYGIDGGFVEVYDGGDNFYVHHNLSNNTDGWMESGGSGSGRSANNMRFAYNTIINSGSIINIHDGDQFNLPVANLQFYNNTYYQTVPSQYGIWNGGVGSVVARNNIFHLNGSTGTPPGTHTHNLYRTSASYALGTGERVGDAQFVANGSDFRLKSTSPARGIGTAVSVDLTRSDATGNALNSPPDAGAYQFK